MSATNEQLRTRHAAIMSVARRYIIFRRDTETQEPLALATTNERLEAIGMNALYAGDGIWDCEENDFVEVDE